jgi:altronate dehydratase
VIVESLTRADNGVDAIRLSPQDNVATVLRAVAAGDRLGVACGGDKFEIRAEEAVPICHKISLSEIPVGSDVLKYGHSIGVVSALIRPGTHVHVHNLRSARAQGVSAGSKHAEIEGNGTPPNGRNEG